MTASATSISPPPRDDERPKRWQAFLIALVIFLAIAPALSWVEFSGSMENLNVATALEIRRTGKWLLPTLEGAPRVNKPPLTAWITAAAIRESTLRDLSSRDPDVRHRAYEKLAFEIRLTGLISSCLTILIVYELARILAGHRAGIFSALVFGTTVAFLRFGRQATTDVQLTLWVAATNMFLAMAIFEKKWWIGCTLGGVALGLALMSKGPVALVQTVLPITVYSIYARRRWALAPVVACGFATIIIGGTWFAYAALHTPDVAHKWFTEVTRVGATDNSGRNPLLYLIVFVLILPWLPAVVIGLIDSARDLRAKRDSGLVFLLFSLVIPLLILSFAPDRKDRYALPMMTAAASLCGIVLARWNRPAIIITTVAIMLGGQAAAIAWYRNTRNGRSEMRPLAEAIWTAAPDADIYNARPDDKRVPVDLAIYLNRSTIRDENWRSLTPADRPRVVIIPQRRGEPTPQFPSQWRLLKTTPRDQDQWHAFILPATAPSN